MKRGFASSSNAGTSSSSGIPSKRGAAIPSSSSASSLPMPIPLIDLGEGVDGEMRLTDEARRILQRSCESGGRPIITVCVVGRSRTGKSFLLNRGLLNKVGDGCGGFQVSPSTRACTKGLWIAGAPVPAEDFWRNLGQETPPDAVGCDVMVIDTEGINALDRDQSYDMRIFTLALLLSSVFVYNSLGAIDENAISTLSAVASVAETLKQSNAPQRTRYGGRGGSSLSSSSSSSSASGSSALELPSLLWVVRDFALDIEHEGGEEGEMDEERGGSGSSGSSSSAASSSSSSSSSASASSAAPKLPRGPLNDDDYLEGALSADQLDPRSSKAMLRRVLMDAFPRRACQTMVRPADREEEMKQLQAIPDAQLRPEFVAQLNSVRRKLAGLGRPKRVAGREIDASLFADLVENYVQAINSDRVPAVADAWTQVTRARCEKGVTQAVVYLERLLTDNPDLQLHPVLLHAHVGYGLRNAERVYRQHIRGVPDTAEFDRQLQQRLLVAVASATHRGRDMEKTKAKELAEEACRVWKGRSAAERDDEATAEGGNAAAVTASGAQPPSSSSPSDSGTASGGFPAAAAASGGTPPSAAAAPPPPSSSSRRAAERFLRGLVDAVHEVVHSPHLLPLPPLPPPEYDPSILPPVVEEGTRHGVEQSSRQRWTWMVAKYLAENPELMTQHGVELPSSGVPFEVHASLLAAVQRGAEETRALETEVSGLRETLHAAESRATEAENSLQVTREETATLEARFSAERDAWSEAAQVGEGAAAASLVAETEARLEAKHRQAILGYEADLDEVAAEVEQLRAVEGGLREELAEWARREGKLRDEVRELRARGEAAEGRAAALETELTRAQDKVAAKATELQRITDEHGRERMEWAARLRSSTSEAARASGQAESLTARVKTLEAIAAQIDALRRELHDAQIALARSQAEAAAAGAERDRARAQLEEREGALFEGLRAVREMQRGLKSGHGGGGAAVAGVAAGGGGSSSIHAGGSSMHTPGGSTSGSTYTSRGSFK